MLQFEILNQKCGKLGKLGKLGVWGKNATN
jgi:hypothetical protein